jgi:hypothetical protein
MLKIVSPLLFLTVLISPRFAGATPAAGSAETATLTVPPNVFFGVDMAAGVAALKGFDCTQLKEHGVCSRPLRVKGVNGVLVAAVCRKDGLVHEVKFQKEYVPPAVIKERGTGLHGVLREAVPQPVKSAESLLISLRDQILAEGWGIFQEASDESTMTFLYDSKSGKHDDSYFLPAMGHPRYLKVSYSQDGSVQSMFVASHTRSPCTPGR